MSFGKDRVMRTDVELGDEAAEWLLRFNDPDVDSDGYPDEASRNEAFYKWIDLSPDHLRVFLEMIETHRRLHMIDAGNRIKVEALLHRRADVIVLPGLRPVATGDIETSAELERHGVREREKRRATWRLGPTSGVRRRRSLLRAVAVAGLALLGGAAGYWWSAEQNVYVTKVGEQRSTKLSDGSFIYLNTDSKVDVRFSDHARNIRLVRGEVLFIVEHDSLRPFTVTAGDTTVRALGTQFNVRRRSEGADVAVVEGSVQLTANTGQSAPPAQKLKAGEEAKVVQGRIAAPSRSTVDPLAWRQRRLVFHDAQLLDVADEFNRYNRTKVRIEGDAAKKIMLSGIFDADRPQALVLYAADKAELLVEPVGNDWLIRSR